MSLKLPADFTRKISESLGMTPLGVDALFSVDEDKQGFFVAKLKPGQFLDRDQFKTMCALARDLGGEAYLQGMKAWKIPGPCAKKSPEKPPEPVKKESGGVTPQSVTLDKSKPPIVSVPIAALLSMPFQARLEVGGFGFAELVESVREHGILDPVWVRPKPGGLYEIVAGDRRVAAAKEAGLVEVPVIIRMLNDEEAFILHLTENLQRKDLSEAEKTRALGEFARKYKLSAQQIADKLKMSYRWVCLYLPEEFKDKEKTEAGRAGGEATAEQYRESQESGASLAPKSQDTRQGIPTIPCERCGDPIQGPPIHAGNNKFYCMDCAEILKTEQPETESEPEIGVITPSAKKEPVEKEPEATVSVSVAAPRGARSAVDVGEFECPECNKRFHVEHLQNGKHRLMLVREAVDA